MKKKNLVAMGLAGVLLVGGCVPVLAASITAAGTSSDVPVTFNQAQTFSVGIPASIEVGDTEAAINITATGNLIEGNQLEVTMNEITGKGISVDYYKDAEYTDSGKTQNAANVLISKKSGSLGDSDKVVGQFTNDTKPIDGATLKNSIEDLKIGKKPTELKAGYYKGTVTFTVAITSNP